MFVQVDFYFRRMSTSEITISAQTLLFHINRFKELGGELPEGQWIRNWDLAENLLINSDQRFPVSVIATAVEFAAKQLNDPVLGLTHSDTDFPHVDFVAVIGNYSRTLEEYIHLLSRYLCIHTEIGVFHIHHCKQFTEVNFHTTDRNALSHHQIDGAILSVIKAVSLYQKTTPLAVTIDHACPEGYEYIYEEKFGCPVEFNSEYNSIRYDTTEMTKLRAQESSMISPQLEQQRDQLYGKDLVEKTQFLIRRLLIRGEPKREHIAKELALSLRSYQRHLANENTSFKELLENTRKQMALEHLEISEYSMQQIAMLLGYSETSQFYKAFKRWFNKSPSSYRPMP